MATGELLEAEARERPRMAILAGLAALLTLAAPVLGLVALDDEPDNLPAAALFRHEHQTGLIVSAACSALGLIAIAIVLDFLLRATRARNPALPASLRALPWVGGLGLAALFVGVQIAAVGNFDHFATESALTYDEADAATDYGSAVGLFGLAAQLAFGFALVMISINAMRVGLLPRFLGYLGVISAVLFMVPLIPLPVVQIYWLGALALLLAGRSPSGTPPAWQSGEAVPWPSPAEMRDVRVREAEARRGAVEAQPELSRRKRKRRS